MTPENWSHIKDVFAQLLELDETERAGALLAREDLDAATRQELARLLDLNNRAGEFLDSAPTLVAALHETAWQRQALVEGEVVADRFHVRSLLGRGGMGEVYAAEDLQMGGLSVALKTPRLGLHWSEAAQEGLRKELELARLVTHPNVCRVYDLVLHRHPDLGELVLLSMELLQGRTLSQAIRRDGPLPWPRMAPLVRQMAEALDAAHRAGVVHRDFKSGNVMLVSDANGDERAVVTDFGIAHAWSEDPPVSPQGAPRMSRGTPAYMAPEQFAGSPATMSSDVYAFGVVVWELLAGTTPFGDGMDAQEAIQARREPPAVPGHGHLPLRWQAILRRCLASDPEVRYPTASVLLDAIQRAESAGATGRRWMLGLAATAVASALSYRFRHELGIMGLRFSPGQSLAVLPFENQSGNPSLDLAAEGISDDLIRILAQSSRIRLYAKGSAAQYQKAALAGPSAARPEFLLSGQVRERQGRLHIAFQIIDPESGVALWDRSIERPRAQVSQTAQEISRIVVAALGGQARDNTAVAMATPQSQNADAFNWYLLGRRLAQSRSKENLLRAIDCFNRAIEGDARYALAWSEKAAAQLVLAGYPGYPTDLMLPEAERSALRALELDAGLGEAHLALGAVEQRYHWRWDEALWRYRRVVADKPALATGHHWLAGLLSNLGHHDEAIREITRARELDPLSAPLVNAHAGILVRAGRPAEALPVLREQFSREPDSVSASLFLAQALMLQSRLAEAEETLRKALTRNRNSSTLTAQLTSIVGRQGRRPEATQLATSLEARWRAEQFYPYLLAQAHTGLDNENRVFEWLETAWSRRDPSLVILKVDPNMRVLQDHESYRSMLRRLRLLAPALPVSTDKNTTQSRRTWL